MGAPQIKHSIKHAQREMKRALKRGIGVAVSIALKDGHVVQVGRDYEAVQRECAKLGLQYDEIKDFGVAC